MKKSGNIYTAGEVGAIKLMQSSCEVRNQLTSSPAQEQTDNIKNRTRGQGIQKVTTRNGTVFYNDREFLIRKIMAGFRIMEISHNNLYTKVQKLTASDIMMLCRKLNLESQKNQNLGIEGEKVKMMPILDVCENSDVLFYIWHKVQLHWITEALNCIYLYNCSCM